MMFGPAVIVTPRRRTTRGVGVVAGIEIAAAMVVAICVFVCEKGRRSSLCASILCVGAGTMG